MEKIEQTTTPTNETGTANDNVKVVIVGAGPALKELREAFPDAEFIDTTAPTGEVEEEAPLELLAEIGEVLGKLRETAYSKLKEIAAGFGLGFNERELDALYRLSLAFDPPLAMAVANSACRRFVNHRGQ